MVDLHNQAEGLMLAGGEIKNDFNAFLTVKRFYKWDTLSVSDENENAEYFLTSTKDSSTRILFFYVLLWFFTQYYIGTKDYNRIEYIVTKKRVGVLRDLRLVQRILLL